MPISFRCQPQTACNQLSWNRFLFDDQVLVAVCIALDPTNIYPVNWRFGRLLYVGCYGHDFCGPCWPGGDYYKYCSCTALFSILSFRCRSIHPTRLHANSACGVRWCPWSGVHKLQGEMIGQQGVVQTFADKNWMVQFLTPKCQKNREMRNMVLTNETFYMRRHTNKCYSMYVWACSLGDYQHATLRKSPFNHVPHGCPWNGEKAKSRDRVTRDDQSLVSLDYWSKIAWA